MGYSDNTADLGIARGNGPVGTSCTPRSAEGGELPLLGSAGQPLPEAGVEIRLLCGRRLGQDDLYPSQLVEQRGDVVAGEPAGVP